MNEFSKEDQRPRITLNMAGWRAVTITSMIVTLGLVGTLLAQDGFFSQDPGLPDHPDGLTTLALVLAILAFLVQIFVFVFQTNSSAAAVQRSEQLNGETRNVLSKIEANSAATQAVLFSQFDRLLDYVVSPSSDGDTDANAVEEVLSVDGDAESESQEPATVADVQRIVSEWARPRERPSFATVLPGANKSSEEDLRMVRYMQSWPSKEETEAAVGDLEKLSPLALATLTRFGTLEIDQRLKGQRVGLVRGKAMPKAVQQMIEAGLLRQDGILVMLTDRGRELARSLPIGKAMDSRPDWYDDLQGSLLRPP
jgi:uncharacterized membrane protein